MAELAASTAEQGVALETDFQPGDIQWLLNYTAMHSRSEYRDFPEPEYADVTIVVPDRLLASFASLPVGVGMVAVVATPAPTSAIT